MGGFNALFGDQNGAGWQATGAPSPEQQQQAYANSQAAFNQLQNVANGKGPNPAQAMLNQATGQNAAMQSSMAAGARGANANPALAARQAAMQGAAVQQNAAGQAATMNANQQLGAIGQLNQAAQGQEGLQNQMQQNVNNANASIAGINAGAQDKFASGLISGAAMAAAHGGMIPPQHTNAPLPRFADGGNVSPGASANTALSQAANSSSTNPFLSGWGKSMDANNAPAQGSAPDASYSAGKDTGQAIGKGISSIGGMFGGDAGPAAGGGTSAMASPMSSAGPAMMIMPFKSGGMAPSMGGRLKAGGTVPGKAKVKGDSLKNDNVPAVLSPGEVVIPRSITQGPNAPENAARFVAAVMGGLGPRPAKKAVKKAK